VFPIGLLAGGGLVACRAGKSEIHPSIWAWRGGKGTRVLRFCVNKQSNGVKSPTGGHANATAL
jgi:hypothetical protein